MRVIKDGALVLNSSNVIYEIATPYTEADLFRIKFTQSADVLTLVHPAYPPKELRRYAHDNWQLVDVVTKNGPFEDINIDESVTVYASASTGTITLTASASIFGAEQVGKLFYLEQPAVDSVPVWETSKSTSIDDVRRADSNYYRAVTAGKTGTLRPSHTEGTSWDGWGGSGDDDTGIEWEYLHSGFGIARITAANGTTATAEVISYIPSQVVGEDNASYKWAKYARTVLMVILALLFIINNVFTSLHRLRSLRLSGPAVLGIIRILAKAILRRMTTELSTPMPGVRLMRSVT